jgi:hypothetical protein
MRRLRGSVVVAGTIFLTTLFAVTSCQRAATPAQPEQPAYAPTATVKDLMLSIVDPAADAVWLSVTTVSDEKGTVETRPQNDDDWLKVRHGAVALAEGASLLQMSGRRVARPGEKSVTPGVELEPEEMDALIAKDRGAWLKRAQGLHDISLEVLKAVDAKDADKVFELGEKIEEQCEACHSQYWYPNEKIPELPAAPSQ